MEDDLARTTQFPQRAYRGQNSSDNDLMEGNLDNTNVLKESHKRNFRKARVRKRRKSKSAENTLFFEAKGKIEGLWGGIEVHTRSSPLEGAGEGPSKAQAPPCSLKIRSFVRNGVEAYWYPPNLSGRFQ
ncbi:hypothetical protein CDAR_81411 [Caerostris darwini]|uniref:Uncharacterized protein n=1 Tax=Caerostris darwini TaxID=1538125 RepID=A0AAV4PP06_9ARAC|nr:hypothetical protein CDAR_81411 [Caerostris darwini]